MAVPVGPTKRNPRRLRCLLIAFDSAVSVGISEIDRHLPTIGVPSTNCQTYGVRPPRCSCTSRMQRALFTVDSTLRRLGTMGGAPMRGPAPRGGEAAARP